MIDPGIQKEILEVKRKVRISMCRPIRLTCLIGVVLLLWIVPHPFGVEAQTPTIKTPGPIGKTSIKVDADRVTGTVPPYLFGQFIEHEHDAIQGGLWAELLRDRKFEQGDADRDGVSDGWVPEERIANRYWELIKGRSPNGRYFVDHQEYYGGGASQAIELRGSDSNHASIYQVALQFVKGRRYVFYVYLRRHGTGKAWVDFEKLGGPLYHRKEFSEISERWEKYTGEFTAPADTSTARMRIAFQGAGTLWMDSASLMPADNLRGMRGDVVDALRPLRIPVMRYPGGCFADTYHWKDAIGPRDRRPETWTRVWDNWDPNDFGIDEFMDFAKELGFEAHITTNYGSGTAEEAADWVEYTNDSADSPMGKLRAQNGHPLPYGIKFWAVGNEAAWLCAAQYIGSNQVREYATRYQQYKNAMQKVDPAIRVIAAGVPPGPPTWDRELLGLLPVDLLAITIYTGEPEGRSFGSRICDYENFYRKVVAEPEDVNRRLEEVVRGLGDRFPANRRLIAITELNSWWLSERFDPDYRLCNALYWAGVFNVLLRRADQVFMAECNTTLNVQGILRINPVGLKLTPPYFAYLLYRNHIGSDVLDTVTVGPMTSFNPQLPAVDSIATLDPYGRTLYLAVINRNEAEDAPATIHIKGWTPTAGAAARVFELNGKDKNAANPYGSTDNVNIRKMILTRDSLPFTYNFPAHSVTVVELSGHHAAP